MIFSYNEEISRVLRLHYNSLQEKDRRRYAAVEALKLGRGGVTYISKLLAIDRNTIIEGKRELLASNEAAQIPLHRQRRPGGGRKKKDNTAGR